MVALVPVILSGGIGSRLWPLSRQQRPKQLANLIGERSLLQETAIRAAALPETGPPLIVCGVDHHEAIAEQLSAVDTTARAIVVEPVGRNTAPAVAAAALCVERDELLLVLPADHLVADDAAFAAAVAAAARAAASGHLVTFGVTPTSPHTGYGYIRQGAALDDSGIHAVDAFVEKPDEVLAARFVEEGGYTWNSGMFLFAAGTFIDELERHRPDMLAAVTAAVAAAAGDDGLISLDPELFSAIESESVDYAVMEHTDLAAVVPLDAGWNDIGSWSALWQLADKDDDGNVLAGRAYTTDVRGSYVRAGDRPVAVVGLEDVIVIDTGDAVLVTSRAAAEAVKDVVNRLGDDGRPEVVHPPEDGA